MKKFFVTLAAFMGLAAVNASAAEYNYKELVEKAASPLYQNRLERNQDVVKSALEYVKTIETKTDFQRISIIRLKVWIYDQTDGVDRSAAGVKKYLDNLIAETKFENPVSGKDYARLLNLHWRAGEKEFAQSIYNIMKATPGAEDFTDFGIWAAALGNYEEAYNVYFNSKKAYCAGRAVKIAIDRLNDPVKAFAAAKVITTSTATADVVKIVLNTVANKLTGDERIPASDMKNFLQNLNRKYTSKLSDDSKTWEPIISKIRTMLEAY